MRTIHRLLVGTCVALCLAAGLVGGGGPAQAGGVTTLYKWVDADGVTHYSDQPQPGAEEIQVQGAQSYKGGSRKPSGAAKPKPPTPAASYTAIQITRPEPGQTFVNPDGHIDVSAALEPGLFPGHQLWVVLDGQRQTEPLDASFTKTVDITRGTHQVAALVTDEAGREVIGSPPVEFYVRETTRLTPPQGPLVPQKPRP
jgi:hypothetical protein